MQALATRHTFVWGAAATTGNHAACRSDGTPLNADDLHGSVCMNNACHVTASMVSIKDQVRVVNKYVTRAMDHPKLTGVLTSSL